MHPTTDNSTASAPSRAGARQRAGLAGANRRCFGVLLNLLQYRVVTAIDLFLLRQNAPGPCAFKRPAKTLAGNPTFNFRDAFTRELSVNLVAALNEPERFHTPTLLRRPLFDVERVEIPARCNAAVRIVVGKGVASIAASAPVELPFPQWAVAENIKLLKAGADYQWSELLDLFLRDGDNVELLEILARRLERGESPRSQAEASLLSHQFELWAHHAATAIAVLSSVRDHFVAYFSNCHSPSAAAARVERQLPKNLVVAKINYWSKLTATFKAAGTRLRANYTIASSGFKVTALEIYRDSTGAASLPDVLCAVLDAAYRKALANISAKGWRSGGWSAADQAILIERFGAPTSQKSRRETMVSFLEALHSTSGQHGLPEPDLEKVLTEKTRDLVAARLTDWLAAADSSTANIDSLRYA